MQLEQLDRAHVEALQARLEAALDLAADVVEAAEVEAHLGRDVGLPLDLLEQPAERLLGLAVAIGGCRVDPVDAGVERALERLAPGGVVLVDQDAADPAAAEHQLGDLEAGPAEGPVTHLFWPLR